MPVSALVLCVLALGPFVGCGLGALAYHPAVAAEMLTGLIAWSALVLTFFGGLHWGLAMFGPYVVAPAAVASERERHARIGLGALPPILGWVALMLPLVAPYWLALALLIVVYIVALAVEHRFRARVILPARYLPIRWMITIVAVAMLTTVLTLRLLGQTIVL
jgi:hypothetical protein